MGDSGYVDQAIILVTTTYSSEQLAQVYIREIIRLHGVPISIIFDRVSQFTRGSGRSYNESWAYGLIWVQHSMVRIGFALR